MLQIEQLPDGTITTEGNSYIVPQQVLRDIRNWMRQGINIKDIVEHLHPRTVPSLQVQYGVVFYNSTH